MQIPIYQVDAFSRERFAGNPAAVCVLESWLDDALLQSIAAENNLSETAFLVAGGDGYALRWLTPVHEVDLCGHATLAAGFVVLTELAPERDAVTFTTRAAGDLAVRRQGERLRMTLPSRAPSPVAAPPGLSEALGVEPLEVLRASKLTAVLESEAAVAGLAPDLAWVAAHVDDGLIATAPGERVDFVSRFFAPAAGIDEDPVTGSAHCELAPYWAARLGRDHLEARQISSRGGDLSCEVDGDRVHLVGDAVLFLRGYIEI